MGNGSPVSSSRKNLFLLLLLLCSIVLTNSTLLITLNTQSLDQDSVLIIQFCKLCPSPEREGTIGETHHSPSILFLLLACFVLVTAHALMSKYGVKEYHLTGGRFSPL
jgi:hypothetical protein